MFHCTARFYTLPSLYLIFKANMIEMMMENGHGSPSIPFSSIPLLLWSVSSLSLSLSLKLFFLHCLRSWRVSVSLVFNTWCARDLGLSRFRFQRIENRFFYITILAKESQKNRLFTIKNWFRIVSESIILGNRLSSPHETGLLSSPPPSICEIVQWAGWLPVSGELTFVFNQLAIMGCIAV